MIKHYKMRVSRSTAFVMSGRINQIIFDKNSPVILLEVSVSDRKLSVRTLTLWEKIRFFINPEYKQK